MSEAIQKQNQIPAQAGRKVKILVVTGSSGGHIFPALGFLTALKNRYKDLDLLLVLPKANILKAQLAPSDFNVRYICVSPITPRLRWGTFLGALRFFGAMVESLGIILKFRPTIAVGFGSLACVPVFVFAKLFGIKTCIHEQNVIPGEANKFLFPFTDKIAISFPETRGYFKNNADKIFLTGNPLRQDLVRIEKLRAREFFWPAEAGPGGRDNLTILVMGGSQGSQRINAAFFSSLSAISGRIKLQVIHLAGVRDYELFSRRYKDLNVAATLFGFFNQIHYAYSACDLAITRSGALTIAELMHFQVPAVLIPYPYARRHQLANARVLEKKGAAIIIDDEELDSGKLSQVIAALVEDPLKVERMRSAYGPASSISAADLLVDEAMSLTKGN